MTADIVTRITDLTLPDLAGSPEARAWIQERIDREVVMAARGDQHFGEAGGVACARRMVEILADMWQINPKMDELLWERRCYASHWSPPAGEAERYPWVDPILRVSA